MENFLMSMFGNIASSVASNVASSVANNVASNIANNIDVSQLLNPENMKKVAEVFSKDLREVRTEEQNLMYDGFYRFMVFYDFFLDHAYQGGKYHFIDFFKIMKSSEYFYEDFKELKRK